MAVGEPLRSTSPAAEQGPKPSTAGLDVLIRLLGEPPDPSILSDPGSWELVKVNAGAYGVSALAAFAARPYASVEQRSWCDAVLTRHWHKHDQDLAHLQNILNLLNEAGIEALVLKGPLLARRHYQPPFIRKPSVDIDLAIRERDIAEACNALAAAGYSQLESFRQARSYGYDVHLLHASLPRVELHFRMSHGATGIPVDEFFSRAVSVPLPNGKQAWILDAADEILHLILHLAHHRFPMFFNLYEIRLIWRQSPSAVRGEAVRRAIGHHFAGAFAMTEVAFQTTWHESFLPAGTSLPKTWLHWRLNEKLYRQCSQWSSPSLQLTFSNRIRGRWLDLQMTDRVSDALRFAAMFVNVARYRLLRQEWGTIPPARMAPRDR